MFDISFTYPYILLGLLGVFGFAFFHQKKSTIAFYAPNPLITSYLQKTMLLRTSNLLIVLIFSLGILFLSRPTIQLSSIQSKPLTQDIMIVLDISKSMLAEDISPNRIEKAKEILNSFIDRMEHNRVGLIIFAGKPFIVSPPTTDYRGIRHLLDQIQPESIDQDIPGLSGTAIGDGILLANTFFTGANNTPGSIILLTDGTYNIGIDPRVAIQETRQLGVKMYVVGIGNPEGIDLYTTDRLGEKRYFLDVDGKRIKANLDETLMKGLTDSTHGMYYLAEDAKSFQEVFTEIEKRTKSSSHLEKSIGQKDISTYIAFMILILGILQVLIYRIYTRKYNLL